MFQINDKVQFIDTDNGSVTRAGTIYTASKGSFFGQFLTIRLDEPFVNRFGTTIKTMSMHERGYDRETKSFVQRVTAIEAVPVL